MTANPERIAILKAALEPVAKEAAFYRSEAPDGAKARYPGNLTIGQVREAARALGLPDSYEAAGEQGES